MEGNKQPDMELISQISYMQAMLELVQTIAKQVGITEINGITLEEYFNRRRCEITKKLLAELAEISPTLALQLKWDWVECAEKASSTG